MFVESDRPVPAAGLADMPNEPRTYALLVVDDDIVDRENVRRTLSRAGIGASIDEAGAGRVRLSVRDTGCGIPRDKLPVIFEPFVQVESAQTSDHKGTGLGLTISREFARGVGGDLQAESEPGVGSAFILTLQPAG